MRKTVRWTAAALAFLVLGLALFAGTAEILRRKTAAESDMVHSFYEIEKDSLDVLFLGSSHLYYGVQPGELWGQYGIASYVMGSPEQTAATSYYLLKEAFSRQKPKVVVMESYYLWYNGLYNSEARLRQAFDGMRMGEAKVEMVNDLLKEKGRKEKLSWYLPFLYYHTRWDALESYDFHTKPYLKGARIDYTVRPIEDPGVEMEAADIPEVNLTYLEKILALCRENGAEFVMIALPYGIETDQERYDRRQGLNLMLEAYLQEQGIPFLFYQKEIDAGIDFSTDFRDKTHLNTFGAEKISAHLGGWLAEEYGLSDHRRDAAYASWESDYEKYRAEKQILQENPVDTAD